MRQFLHISTSSQFYWYAFLGVVGSASTAMEIIGLRFLAPLFGSSLPVWGSVIATVIGGLAWGYSLGGRRAQEKLTYQSVFRQAALGAAFFLWMPGAFQLISWWRNVILAGQWPGLILMVIVVSLFVMLVPAVVFGMVSPMAVQVEAQRQKQPAGQVAGRIFTITTVGSLLGILIPSFFTIPFLGSRESVWLFAGAVLLLSSWAWFGVRFRRIALLSAAIIVIAFVPLTDTSRIIYAQETPYQYVTVRRGSDANLLTFDAALGVQSMLSDSVYTNAYWDYVALLPLFGPSRDELDVLVLGAAGSSGERQLVKLWENDQKFHFTSVDIDGDLFAIGDQYFDAPARRTVAADARAFVNSDRGEYDIILVDGYTRELTMPFHLVTREFFIELKPRLRDGGLVAVNVNSCAPNTTMLNSLARTVLSVYPYLEILSVPDSCNRVLLAREKPITIALDVDTVPEKVRPVLSSADFSLEPNPEEGLLLTDNRAPVSWLGFMALLQR